MRLTRIRAADFRNLTFADVVTDAPRVFLLGDNGQGKTNLLEAAALVSSFRSFRTTDISPLVRAGCTEARLRLDVRLSPTEQAEIEVIQQFLPAALGESEIADIIKAAIAEAGATSMKEMGAVMNIARPQLMGRADMGLVSQLVKKLLS
jgi:recombinational DNA repair ATPase RecF